MSEIKKRILSSIVVIPISLFCIIKGSFFFNFFLITIFFIGSYEWHLMAKKKSFYIFGFFFLILSIYCCYLLRYISEDSYFPFLIVTIICILTDIGGYIFGKIFKGPKLTKYSPNKTYSGLVGSFLLALCFIPFIFHFELVFEPKFSDLIYLIIIISASSQFGDILFSYFKILSNIKDK